jgi:Uma2 family endonuclease
MTSVPDERIVLRSVDWEFYEQLIDLIPDECHIHLDYDGKHLEIVSPKSLPHDRWKSLIRQLVEAVAQELAIPYIAVGETTWKRPEVRRGLEADEAYYFQPRTLAAAAEGLARKSKDVADYPDPDLAIEVDTTQPKFDGSGIYAALRIAEVWRVDGQREQVVIERLKKNGRYAAAKASAFLPIRAEDVTRWVVVEDPSDHSAWARRLRAWVRAELATRGSR